jgi:hypothetical protein
VVKTGITTAIRLAYSSTVKMAIELIKSFLQQANAMGTRSTVLTDLRWFAAIILSALLGAIKFTAPYWVLVFLLIILGLIALVYLSAYIYFGIKCPDALRSEKFTLSKLAIERSVIGDSLAGFIDPSKSGAPLNLPISTPKKENE